MSKQSSKKNIVKLPFVAANKIQRKIKAAKILDHVKKENPKSVLVIYELPDGTFKFTHSFSNHAKAMIAADMYKHEVLSTRNGSELIHGKYPR